MSSKSSWRRRFLNFDRVMNPPCRREFPWIHHWRQTEMFQYKDDSFVQQEWTWNSRCTLLTAGRPSTEYHSSRWCRHQQWNEDSQTWLCQSKCSGEVGHSGTCLRHCHLWQPRVLQPYPTLPYPRVGLGYRLKNRGYGRVLFEYITTYTVS